MAAIATPPTQVRSPADDESPQGGGRYGGADGERLHMDEATGSDEDDYGYSDDGDVAPSVTSSAAAEETKAVLQAATAPPKERTNVTTPGQWCVGPCVALLLLVAAVGGGIGIIAVELDQAAKDVAYRSAERACVVSASAIDAAVDLRGQAAGLPSDWVPSYADVAQVAADAAPKITMARDAVGDAVAVSISRDAAALRTVATPLHSAIFGPLLCSECSPAGRFTGHAVDSWWARAPSLRTSGIVSDPEARDDAILSNTARAQLSLLRNGSASNPTDRLVVQYSVSHVIAAGVAASEGPATFPAGATAALLVGAGIGFASIVLALEFIDRSLLPKWRRAGTIDERDKLDRIADGDDLEDDESDVASSVMSSESAGPSASRQKTTRLTLVAAATFIITALWGSAGVAVCFNTAVTDAGAIGRSVGMRTELAVTASAFDTVVRPAAEAVAPAANTSHEIMRAAQSAFDAAVEARVATVSAFATPAVQLVRDEASGTVFVVPVSTDDAEVHPSLTLAKGRAIGLAFGAAIIATVLVTAAVAFTVPRPMPLSLALRRAAAARSLPALSSRQQSSFAAVVSLPFFVGGVITLVAVACAAGVAAGSVVLLREHAAALTVEAMRVVATAGVDTADEAAARAAIGLGPSDLPALAAHLPSSRHIRTVRLSVSKEPLASRHSPSVAVIAAADDAAGLCARGLLSSNLTLAAPIPVNLRLLLSGQPPVTASAYVDRIGRWGIEVKAGNAPAPEHREVINHGLWARSVGTWTVAAGGRIDLEFTTVEEAPSVSQRFDAMANLPQHTNNDDEHHTHAAIARAGYPRVVWVPLTVVLCLLAVGFLVSDVLLFGVASGMRRSLESMGTARIVAAVAAVAPIVLVLLVAWPIAAAATLNDAWAAMDHAPASAELRVTAGTVAAGVALADVQRALAANGGLMTASAAASSSSSSPMPLPAAIASRIRRRASVVVFASAANSTIGSPDSMPAAALVNTTDACSATAQYGGSARAVACDSAIAYELLAELRTRANLGVALSSTNWSDTVAWRRGPLFSLAGSDARGFAWGYAAAAIGTSATRGAGGGEALVEALVVADNAHDEALDGTSDDALHSITVTVLVCGCLSVSLLLAVAGFMLLPLTSERYFLPRKLLQDRSVEIAGGMYRDDSEGRKEPLLAPGSAAAAEMLPLGLRRREVASVLAFVAIVAVAASVHDGALAYARSQVDGAALQLSSVTSGAFSAPTTFAAVDAYSVHNTADEATTAPSTGLALTATTTVTVVATSTVVPTTSFTLTDMSPVVTLGLVARVTSPSIATTTLPRATFTAATAASSSPTATAPLRRSLGWALGNASAAIDDVSGRMIATSLTAAESTAVAGASSDVFRRADAAARAYVDELLALVDVAAGVVDVVATAAEMRANGTDTSTASVALWTVSGTARWASSVAGYAATMLDACTAAAVSAADLAEATAGHPAALLSTVDVSLTRCAAAAAALSNTEAANSLPTATLANAQSIATRAADATPPVGSADIASLVGLASSASTTATVNGRSYGRMARVAAEMVTLNARAGHLRASSAAVLLALRSAAEQVRRSIVDRVEPAGQCLVASTQTAAVTFARISAGAVSALQGSEGVDRSTPLASLLSLSALLAVVFAVATTLRRRAEDGLAAMATVGRPVAAVIIAAAIAIAFTVGVDVTSTDATDAIRAEALADAHGRVAYVESAAGVLAGIENVVAACAWHGLGVEIDASRVRSAALVAGSRMRTHALRFGQDASGDGESATAFNSRSPLGAATEEAMNAARSTLDQLVALAETAAADFAFAVQHESRLATDALPTLSDAAVLRSASGIVADFGRAVPLTTADAAAHAMHPTATVAAPVSAQLAPQLRAATMPPAAVVFATAGNTSTASVTATAARAHVSLVAARAAASLGAAVASTVVSRRAGSLALRRSGAVEAANTASAWAAVASAGSADLDAAVSASWLTMTGSPPPREVSNAVANMSAIAGELQSLAVDASVAAPSSGPVYATAFSRLPAQTRSDYAAALQQVATPPTQGRAAPFADAIASAVRGLSYPQRVVLFACGGTPAPIAHPAAHGIAGTASTFAAAVAGLVDPASSTSPITAVNRAAAADAASPWSRAWLRASRDHSGHPATVAATDASYADSLRIATLTAADDALQRLAIGGIWAIAAIATILAFSLRMLVPEGAR